MKAVVCSEFGGLENLSLEEQPNPAPGPGEVGIKVEAAGLNFPDLLTVAGKYQFKPELPFVPGAEAAGTIESVGEGVQGLTPGQRVFSTMLTGAFAERCVVPAGAVCDMGRLLKGEFPAHVADHTEA